MTFEEYHLIKAEASKRMYEYTKMVGNYDQHIERKEDDLKYWIAVVASEIMHEMITKENS